MQTIYDIKAKWESLQLDNSEALYIGYDDSHPLQFFIGMDAMGNREFFIILENKPRIIPVHSRSVEVLYGIRKDGKYTLLFKLIKPEQQEVFTHLCWDLAESSRAYKDMEKGCNKVISRYLLWQKLMEKGNIGLLSDQEIKGLWGEIMFLKGKLFSRYGIAEAVEGWTGPSKSDRDFCYSDLWYEIKTTNPGASSLKITSIEQLDTDSEGRLVWIQAEKTSSTEANAKSLPDIIMETKSLMEDFPETIDKFESKLLEAGYIEQKHYNNIYFAYKATNLYKVDEKFPKILRKDLNSGITAVSYEISISSINIFETN